MADQQPSGATPKHPTQSSPPPPSYSAWRTAAHLYFPFITVALLMLLGTPFNDAKSNVIYTWLMAIPTNWLASFFYPTDRPEPTPKEAVCFSKKGALYRVVVLFTYRWLSGAPFELTFFTDFMLSYGLSASGPAGTKPRRSEFAAHLPWWLGSWIVLRFAPSFWTWLAYVVERSIWRETYIALVDDLVGVLGRPNLSTWQGKLRLVLVQAFVIMFSCYLLLSWRRDLILGDPNYLENEAARAAFNVQEEPVEMGQIFEDDGDRFLI